MKKLKLFILFFLFLSYKIDLKSQIVRINEFSQGSSGSKEWVELVVGSSSTINSTNCVLSKLNISGWILDDNNGDFSPPNHFTGSGVASGHMRFKNTLPWINLPVGAIIVIYNAADRDINIPADDPFDWINSDCVYIIPSNHSSIEYCTTLPSSTSCTTRTGFGSCSYVSTGNWNNVSLANAGDAIQVRNSSFTLVHGIVYGKSTSSSGCTTTPDMIGNSLAPLISNSPMSITAASFMGTNDADYFDPNKWSLITASSATPGYYNDAINENYIVNTLRGGCTCHKILPIENTIIINQNIQSPLKVTILGNILRINTIFKQDIYVYNSVGKLTNIKVNKNNRLDLSGCTSNGFNLIRVVIDDRMGSTFILKYIK